MNDLKKLLYLFFFSIKHFLGKGFRVAVSYSLCVCVSHLAQVPGQLIEGERVELTFGGTHQRWWWSKKKWRRVGFSLILAVSDVHLTWSCSPNQLSIMSWVFLLLSASKWREWNNTDVLLYMFFIFLPRSIRLSWRTFSTLMYRLEKTVTLTIGSCHPFLCFSFQ